MLAFNVIYKLDPLIVSVLPARFGRRPLRAYSTLRASGMLSIPHLSVIEQQLFLQTPAPKVNQ